MPRKKKYPNYNPEQILNEMIEAVASLYSKGLSLRMIGDKLDLDQQKVRKLLCTASFKGIIEYRSDTAEKILEFFTQGKNIPEIIRLTGLSRSSVQSYLPYTKVPYKGKEISANAERLRRYRRNLVAEELKERIKLGDMDALWKAIILYQGCTFRTVKGLEFHYTICGGEMVVDKKKGTITKSSVEIAYRNVLSMGGYANEAKGLKAYGASYLYPIFERLGVIEKSGNETFFKSE